MATPEQASSKDSAAPRAAAKAARRLFSINFKFSFFIAVLLFGLFGSATLFIRNQLRTDFSREVSERGATIARNLATPLLELINAEDYLTVAVLVKGAVEENKPAMQHLSFWGQLMADLKRSLGGSGQRNEGVSRILVVDQKDKPGMVVGDSETTEEHPYDPPLILDQYAGKEPFPVFSDAEGRLYYDIRQDVVLEGATLANLHLYLRRDLISETVRVATTRLVAIMVGSLLIGVIILSLVVRYLMRPLGSLVEGVTAVSQGDFSKIIQAKQRDELGDLIEAYNGMARSLREKEAVQEALAKYTSKDLVQQMLTDKSKLALGGQRIHATIYFSVLRGMAAMASQLKAEDFVALVNEYLEIESSIIDKNGGSIDKYIGDEVMALWGLNGEDKVDQAYRCVKTGVEVQDAIEKHNLQRKVKGMPTFECSIGINCGDVVSGNMGSSVKMDNTVLGGQVNLAARLGLVAAQGGQTIISEKIYAMVAQRFKIDKLAPMPLKGIKEPVPLFWPRKVLN